MCPITAEITTVSPSDSQSEVKIDPKEYILEECRRYEYEYMVAEERGTRTQSATKRDEVVGDEAADRDGGEQRYIPSTP